MTPNNPGNVKHRSIINGEGFIHIESKLGETKSLLSLNKTTKTIFVNDNIANVYSPYYR